MRVLIGCEYTATVRDAFRERGHDAWSCDIDATEGDSQWHYQCCVKDAIRTDPMFDEPWDLAIFHPPCTYLSNSGVQWLYPPAKLAKGDGDWAEGVELAAERWKSLIAGAELFRYCLQADIPRIACENPIMNPYAQTIIGRNWDQKIQPYEYGHPEQKAICLWLKNLPKLNPTHVVDEREQKIFHMGPQKRESIVGKSVPDFTKALPMPWRSVGKFNNLIMEWR